MFLIVISSESCQNHNIKNSILLFFIYSPLLIWDRVMVAAGEVRPPIHPFSQPLPPNTWTPPLGEATHSQLEVSNPLFFFSWEPCPQIWTCWPSFPPLHTQPQSVQVRTEGPKFNDRLDSVSQGESRPSLIPYHIGTFQLPQWLPQVKWTIIPSPPS